MTYRTPCMLVCVYYRVAAGDAQRAISTVREFQRTLPSGGEPIEAEVLLRCDLTFAANAADGPGSLSVDDAPPPPAADATLMETYRLALPAPAGDPAAVAAVQAFLATLEAAAQPLSGLLRGKRHVEPFFPCVL